MEEVGLATTIQNKTIHSRVFKDNKREIMDNQLYYLIKDKPKFNKVRFNHFHGLTREIVEGNEFFYDADGIIRMENSNRFNKLLIDYMKIWRKINIDIDIDSNSLITNELCTSMVAEVFKMKPFPTLVVTKHHRKHIGQVVWTAHQNQR